MKLKLSLSFCLFLLCVILRAQPAGYGFGKQLVIQAGQVSGTAPLNNFPVLVSIVDNDLRSTANGGNVENTNGFDVIFTLGDCASILSHDLEYYDPVTGELNVWVQLPLVNHNTDTPFFMFYGNNTVAADQSSTNIWTDVNYDGVWHLHNDVLDASGSGNNGVNYGSTNVPLAHTSGNGRNFVDPNHWVELNSHPNKTGSFSYSAWVRTSTNNVAGQRIICDDATNGAGCHALSIGDPGAGRVRFYIRGMGPVSLDSPGGVITNNTWHYVAATFNSVSSLKSLYVDGVLVNSGNVAGTLSNAGGNASIGGEVAAGESGNRLNGDLDEVRSNAGALTADWIATEYNNQSNPGAFIATSAEFTAAVLCALLPIDLLHFNATPDYEREQVKLDWSTASELNNEFFTVERSSNGIEWNNIAQINGAGNSNNQINYQQIDESPLLGISYYRLKQTDFDGQSSYSNVVKVDFINEGNQLIVYPNPSEGVFYLNTPLKLLLNAELYNNLGQKLDPESTIIRVYNNKVSIDLSSFPNGIYLLKSRAGTVKLIKE